MAAGPIYILFVLRDKIPNEYMMVGEVYADCTAQAY